MPQEVKQQQEEEKSFLGIIVHSFFIIPFLIAVFCVLLFGAVNLLTREKRTVYDYLNDVKTGGVTKRWQGAFELSKLITLEPVSQDVRFQSELIAAFEKSKTDDPRVRQYLALAMGRTENKVYSKTLIDSLNSDEDEENITAIIYALGMLRDPSATKDIIKFTGHSNSRLRSIAIVSLGNINDPNADPILQRALTDSEPNVQWGAAISLAKRKNNSGKNILLQLLNRNYLSGYPEVDQQEQTNLILSAMEAAAQLKDKDLTETIRELSKTDKNMKIRSKALEILNHE